MRTRILLFIAAASMALTNARGQQCPIPCDKEAFPYYFCDVTGARHLKCSSDPQSDTANGWKPVLTHMPGCVNVIPIDPSLDYQPVQAVPPKPPDPNRETIYESYLADTTLCFPPWNYPWDPDSGAWEDDYSEWQAGWEQWDLDSANFFSGKDQEMYDTTGMDAGAAAIVNDYYNNDYLGLWNVYYLEYIDSAQHANGYDVEYDTVWNDNQATQDAQDGLNAWEALCHIKGDPNCCIQIEPNNNKSKWPGNYDPTQGQRSFALGMTPGLGGYCSDEASCPDTSWRNILYNATNNFFYQKNDNLAHPDPSFILHPTAPFEGWFTGTTAPTGTDTMAEYAEKDFSFRQVIWHEIGHFLGLSHPDGITDDSAQCLNNVTKCHGTQIMTSGTGMPPQPGVDPIGIQPDDACEFQKLYCSGTGNDGVSDSPEQPEPPSPEIFPNPTTGASLLQYEVPNRSFVQIAIYDALGSGIKDVFSEYVGAGQHSISLGTESLPSGHYVCRVRVGEDVTYINIVVKK